MEQGGGKPIKSQFRFANKQERQNQSNVDSGRPM